jgi:hypothetical protein
MAAAESPSQSPERLPRIQPLPLSSKQEDEIRKIYNKNVREHCTDQIRGTHLTSLILAVANAS